MDFEQFLAEAPLQYLLGLMAVPLTGAALLVAYLVFSFTRRRKKSKMKLGVQPKREEATPMDDAQKANAPANDTPPEKKSPPDTGELNLGVLGAAAAPASPAEPAEPDEAEETPPVNLAARLGTVESPVEQPAVESKPPSAEPDAPPAAPAAENAPVELLRLLRDPVSNQLIVEVAGQRYTKLADISDRKIGQFVLQLVAHLLAFTNGVIVTDAGMKSLPAPNVGSLPEPPFTPTPAAAPPQPDAPPAPPPDVEAALLESLRQQTGPAQSPAAAAPKKGGLLGLGGKPSPPPETRLELSLADEINDIVQKKLAASSLAATTKIDIIDNLTGGLKIVVNGQAYALPDDIPDEAVRNLIKESIKEWERS